MPKIVTPWLGRRSMMILNVSHKLASENQVKTSWAALNYATKKESA